MQKLFWIVFGLIACSALADAAASPIKWHSIDCANSKYDGHSFSEFIGKPTPSDLSLFLDGEIISVFTRNFNFMIEFKDNKVKNIKCSSVVVGQIIPTLVINVEDDRALDRIASAKDPLSQLKKERKDGQLFMFVNGVNTSIVTQAKMFVLDFILIFK